jgi:catechol 2,3-dioxygenase-like lactoylglutathione lyase family enzyme
LLTQFKAFPVVPSKDLDRAKAWYEEKTGMRPTKVDPGGLWYECADGTWFFVAASAYAGTAQNTAATFQVEGIENVMAALRAMGLLFEEYDLPDFKTIDGLFAMGPYKAAWFKDADDNIIEISEVLAEN